MEPVLLEMLQNKQKSLPRVVLEPKYLPLRPLLCLGSLMPSSYSHLPECVVVFHLVSVSAPRYHWCSSLSYASSCTLLNHRIAEQNLQEECQPRKWGTITRWYASYAKFMTPTRKDCSNLRREIGPEKDLLVVLKKCKLQWYGHISCWSNLAKAIGARHSERREKRRRTKDWAEIQPQEMNMPGMWHIPEGSVEQGTWEKTGHKVICGSPVTLAVKGLMMRRDNCSLAD